MIYRPKILPVINAFKFDSKECIPLDFPAFTMFNYPKLDLNQKCPKCNLPWKDHASYEGTPICPHQYILYKNNKITSIMGVEPFENIYILLCNEDANIIEEAH